ncbi:MAG: DUF4105 domain-containing protein [Patescibacteria group bacterium]
MIFLNAEIFIACIVLYNAGMGKMCKRFVAVVFVALVFLAVFLHGKQPSNDRAWSPDQDVLPTVKIEKENITIKNIRNFTYRSTTEYTPGYYDRTILLDEVQTVWFMMEPFDTAGAAHTLVSFGLSDGTYIAISVEIRKEKGESFSPLKGLFREYELVYVIADERDVIGFRANYRHDDVYLYPVVVTSEQAQAFFLSMVTRAQALQEKPEFYNTITNTCTTNIVDHVNEISPGRIPWSFKIILPASSDEFAYDLGLFGTTTSFADMRERYHINERAREYADAVDFSKRIRE